MPLLVVSDHSDRANAVLDLAFLDCPVSNADLLLSLDSNGELSGLIFGGRVRSRCVHCWLSTVPRVNGMGVASSLFRHWRQVHRTNRRLVRGTLLLHGGMHGASVVIHVGRLGVRATLLARGEKERGEASEERE